MIKRNRGKTISILCIIALLVSFTACSSGGDKTESDGSAPAEKFTFNFATHDSPEARTAQYFQSWADEINEKTDGNVTINIHGSGSLVAGKDAYDAVKSGQADIAWIYTMYTPGVFPLSEVISLPMIGNSHPAQVAKVLWDLYDETPELQQELSAMKVLILTGNPPNFMATSKLQIKSLADMKGMDIRTPVGTLSEVMKLWGANPMNVGIGDIYDALQKGNIAASVNDYHAIEGFKLYEVMNYYIDMPVYEGPYMVGMNMDKFNSMPPEYQKVFEETTGRDGSIKFGEMYMESEQIARTNVLAANGEEIKPDAAAVAEFKKIADDYADTWPSSINIDGFDAKAYLEKARELVEKHAYN